MSKIFKSISAPLAIALVATPALAAEPVGRASPTVEDLKVEINQLTAEVEELKKGDSPFTVNGYYRLQATSESLDTTDDNPASFTRVLIERSEGTDWWHRLSGSASSARIAVE